VVVMHVGCWLQFAGVPMAKLQPGGRVARAKTQPTKIYEQPFLGSETWLAEAVA
jgi:hypothetical protein